MLSNNGVFQRCGCRNGVLEPQTVAARQRGSMMGERACFCGSAAFGSDAAPLWGFEV